MPQKKEAIRRFNKTHIIKGLVTRLRYYLVAIPIIVLSAASCLVKSKSFFLTALIVSSHTYLTSEHGTKVVTAGSQDDPVSWEICVLHPQSDITECVALAE